MNGKWKFVVYGILGLFSVGIFPPLTFQFYYVGNTWYGSTCEKICYALWGISLALIFCATAKKCTSTGKKATIGAVISLGYPCMVFFANCFCQYLHINSLFLWQSPLSFQSVMTNHLNYSLGTGGYRYLLVLVGMASFCGFLMAFPKIKTAYHHWLDKREMERFPISNRKEQSK